MIMIMIMIMMSTDYLSILSPVCAPVPCSPIPLHYGAGDLAAGSPHCWSNGRLCGLHPPLLRYRHQYIIPYSSCSDNFQPKISNSLYLSLVNILLSLRLR